jgi:cell division septation protein DedD
MVRQLATRSQRRLEKKQAVVLLALVLVVSLVSFALGVLVGRSSAGPVVAVAPPQAVRLPVAEAVPPTAAAPVAGERPADSLTFYDSLPKGGQAPLGSGINLRPARVPAPLATAPAPAESAKPSAAAAVPVVTTSMPAKTDVPAPPPAKAAAPVAKAAAPVAKAAAPVAKAAAPAAAGGYLVQAAAFRGNEDAKRLQAKLARKGYAAFTEEVQLGAKGVWYRVYVGPFATAGAADAVVSRLKAEERLTALVRKR